MAEVRERDRDEWVIGSELARAHVERLLMICARLIELARHALDLGDVVDRLRDARLGDARAAAQRERLALFGECGVEVSLVAENHAAVLVEFGGEYRIVARTQRRDLRRARECEAFFVPRESKANDLD